MIYRLNRKLIPIENEYEVGENEILVEILT